MAWFSLIIAGILEVIWAYFMKSSEGFTKLWPSIITIITMIGSFFLLSYSMKTLPLSVAYPIWTGIGAIGAFLVGITLLGEIISLTKIIAAILIVSGLILMKIAK